MPSSSGYQQVPSDDVDVPASASQRLSSPATAASTTAAPAPAQQRQARETVAGRQFNPPPPAPYKRALLLAAIAFMFYLSLKVGSMGGDSGALSGIAGVLERRGWLAPGPVQAVQPVKGQSAEDIAAKLREKYGAEVVHAKRYSNDYKFRPAASPIIKEKLKNGKVRLRGANPGGTF